MMENTNSVSKQGSFFLLILSISLATFMSALDGTIVNIALPTISVAFDISTTAVSWVATAYLLVMAGCVLIFGKISDVIGYKRVFLTGFIIFTVGSFTCGSLPVLFDSFYLLVASRIFQAVGGAMITAIAPAMVTSYIPMDQKGRAMGIIMTLAALGTAIGPAIGGVLTEYISWSWIFYINVPVGIFAVLLGAKVIPHSVRAERTGRFDRYGAGLVFTGLASLLFAMSEGQVMGWTSPVIIAMLAIAACTIGFFVWYELKVTDPLLELRLFKNRNFLVTNLIMSLVFFSFSGINYLLPFFLEYVLGYTTSSAGLVLTSLSFAMMITGLLSGMLYDKTGGRLLCIIAGILLAGGYFMMTLLRVDTTIGYVVLCLIVIGAGLGTMITPVSNMIMLSVAKRYQGMVSSLTSLERFAPMTIGIALFNMIFLTGLLSIAGQHGVTETAPANIKLEVLTAGFDLTFLATFLFGILILVLALVARQEIHPDYTEDEDAGEAVAGLL